MQLDKHTTKMKYQKTLKRSTSLQSKVN